jgi:RND family efflux transporter MFP subunit
MPALLRRPMFWIAIALVLVAAGVGVTMMKGKAAKAAAVAHVEAPTPFSAVAEGKADVEGGIIQVASRTAGVVREVDVTEGDKVRKGQVLARQEDDAPRLAVDTAQATVEQVKAQLQLTQVQIATAEREKARLADLSGVVSRQQVDQASDAIADAEATLASQRAAVDVAQTQLNEARYRLEETIVRAPADGIIVRRYANPGTGASTLNVTPMFDLEPAGARIVRAEVTETDLPTISIGQNVNIVPEADQTKAYPGTVLRRAAVFGARKLQSDDPAERTDERVVEVVVSAEGAPFLVGQRVLVKFVRPPKS